MLLNLVVRKLKCKTNLTTTATFHNGDILGPLSESLPKILISHSTPV